MVPLGFASQTAGSIVRPAAFCGVVGYKPTYGTVNRVGVKMISDTLDTIGVLARSVPDAALFVGALSGRRELLIERALDRMRRASGCAEPTNGTARIPKRTRCSTTQRCDCGKAGASVRDVALPPPFAGLVDAQIAIMVHEVAKSLSHEWLVHRRQLSREMVAMIEAGLAVTPERYDAARALARSCRAALADVFDGIDVVLAPSTVGEAPRRDRGDRRSAVQPDVDAVARAVRPSAGGAGAAGIAGRRHRRRAAGRRSSDAGGGGLDLREALTSSLPALGLDWEHCRSYWIASSARRALAASRRRRRMPRFEMSSCVLQEQ